MAHRSPAYDGARAFGLSSEAPPPSLDLSERTPARSSRSRPARPSSTVRRRRVVPSAPLQPKANGVTHTPARTTKKVKMQSAPAATETAADDKSGPAAAVAGLLVLLQKLARENVIEQSTIGNLKNRLFSGDSSLLIAFNDYVTGENKDELIEALYTAGPADPAEPADELAEEKTAPTASATNTDMGLSEDLMDQLLLTPERVDLIRRSLVEFKLSSLSLIEIWSAFESQAHLDGLTRREFVDCCVRLCNPLIELAGKEAPAARQAETRMLERAVLEQALDRFFELLDRDSGGRVDLPELLVVLALLARGSLTRKLEFCFNVINSRGDDTLTFEELVRFLFACAVLFTAFTLPLPAAEQTSAASPRADVHVPELQSSVWAVAQGLFLLAASDLPNVAQYIADSEAGTASAGQGGVTLEQFTSWPRNPVLLWTSLVADAISLTDAPATDRERALSAELLRKHRPDLLAKAQSAAPSGPVRARAASPSGEEEEALVRELQGITLSQGAPARPTRSPLLSALSKSWAQPTRDSMRHRVPSPFSTPSEATPTPAELARQIRRGIEAANNMSATASKARRAQQAGRKGKAKGKAEGKANQGISSLL